MLKMYHRHTESGESRAYWETFGAGSFEARLRFCDVDPLRPLFLRYAQPGTRMLEGGCGRGQYVAYYAARGVKVVGLDFAQEWLAELRAYDRHLTLCAGDVAALPFASGSFDVYYSGGVVEHFEADAEAALREAVRVLRPGGILLVSVPYFSPLRRVLSLVRRDWKWVSRPRVDRNRERSGRRFYQYVYTRREFERLLAEAGLRVIATQGYAILWGLYDLPLVHRVLARLERRRQSARASADQPTLQDATGLVVRPRAPIPLLKRLLVAEDASVPLAGMLVCAGRWACANMMMYVCEAARDRGGAPDRDACARRRSMLSDLLRRFHDADIRWSERWLVRTPFHPGFWVRRRLEGAVRARSGDVRGVLVDVGCGQKPYESFFHGRIARYIGMEYSPQSGYRGNRADLCGDAAAIPLASASVDSVLCTEVLEHVPDPDAVVGEIARVLKPGGVIICTAAFVYPVHDRFDFFRYSPGTVATLMRRHGLEVDSVTPLSGTGVTLAVLFNLYWFEIGFLWTKWLYPIGLVLRPLLWLLACAINLAGGLLERVLPSDHLSFNHLTIAHRPLAAPVVPVASPRAAVSIQAIG